MVLPGIAAVKRRGRALPKLVTVSLDPCGCYWVSFAVEEHIAPMAPARRSSVGVDLGVVHLATLSNGEMIESPRTLAKRLKQLERLQQRLARQCRGSNRRARNPHRLAARARRRLPARTPPSADPSTRAREPSDRGRGSERRRYGVECEGDPRVSAHERAGEERAQPLGEGRRIRRAPSRQLAYKARWYGRTVVAVDRFFPSSKQCSACAAKHEGLRLDERRWRCASCGTRHDRDVNAARNIEAEGLRILMPPVDTGPEPEPDPCQRGSVGRRERCLEHRERRHGGILSRVGRLEGCVR